MSTVWNKCVIEKIKNQQGSMTVEGAFLMPLLLMVICMVLSLGCYEMEKALVQGLTTTTLYGHLEALRNQEEKDSSEFIGKLREILEKQLIFGQEVSVCTSANPHRLQVQVTVEEEIPFVNLVQFIEIGKQEINYEMAVSLQRPVKIARTRRWMEEMDWNE